MRQVEPWTKYFQTLAENAASRSKDPSTQVGAVVVDKDKAIVSTGYNGFPQGIEENEARWQRPVKYDIVIHAECNAVARAAKRGVSVNECTMYVTHFPCLNCAKTIIAAGIKEVVYGQTVKGWDEDHKKAFFLFNEAGVKVSTWDIYAKAVAEIEKINVIVQ